MAESPDPIVLAADAVERAVKAERDYVDGQIGILVARLNAIDKAAEVLHETVTRTPTEIQREVGHLRELITEQIDALKRETLLIHEASEKAIEKADSASKERLVDLSRRVDELAEKVAKI